MILSLLASVKAFADETAFRVEIEAPKALRDLLEAHLDVVRRSAE